ncbi:putative tail fiber protein [Escherichia phage vB_EcoM-Pr121LW]|uniref:Putative tail fiber protein n=1 Tax=Escherichia phage vB_EcoM-Pr121LW TaxID=2306966 RepID=A0A385F204_9CAUD|nr:putative tail fiber protein [Escherichia phage vB_EcoM-Pr121LW]
MADIKVVRIESLPATTAVTEDDYLVVQQPDLTRRVKIGDVVHVDGTVSHVISFKEGGKLNGPMDFAYFEEEDLYLRWKGEFPHTVPALSSPYSDGGITDAAWMVYTDPSLREELESTIGASMIMTAEGQSVQDVMDVTVKTANDAKALAQRVDFGTVHTVGDVIHLVNFVGPAVIEEGRTTNYPSVAAGEKFLNGVVSRRDTTTVDGIFRGATSGAMYTIAVTNGVATTKRIALRDEFKRLEANNPTRTIIRAGDDVNTAGYLQLDATGRWGMWNQQTSSWQPLAVEQGGTGARDAAGARINLGTFYKQRAALEANFNINNLTGNQDGVYYQPMTANATEENGYPAGSGAGHLIVWQNNANGGAGCRQEYYPFSNVDVWYLRTYQANTNQWTAWQPMVRPRNDDTFRSHIGLGKNNSPAFGHLYLAQYSGDVKSASGIVHGDKYNREGTLEHGYRIYSEVRNDNKAWLTIHLHKGATGAETHRYLGFREDGVLDCPKYMQVGDLNGQLANWGLAEWIRSSGAERGFWGSKKAAKMVIWDGGMDESGNGTLEWGVYNNRKAKWEPLPQAAGGTGATTLAEAQNLFRIPMAAGVKDFLTLPRTAAMVDGKYYPVIVRTDPYYAPAVGTDITIVTRSSSGNDPMNCATLQCHYRTGGWTDRGDSFTGVINFYQNERAILGCVAPTRGKQEYVAFYVEARAFPVSVYTSRNVLEVFTRENDWQVGNVTDNQDGVKFCAPLESADLNLAIKGDNVTNTRSLAEFKGTSGFYTGGGTQWHYIGTPERYAVMSKMTMPKVELWADGIDYLCPGSQTTRKALFSNAGFQAASEGTEDLINNTFTSKCGKGAGLKGQSEFRSTPEAGQVIVRDVVGSAHKFFNFNKDGTFYPPGGYVCQTGADWNNQFGNTNPSKIMAGNVNGPEGSMVVAGLSVGFSGNYAFQMAGRLDQLYTRSIEGGNHRAWNKVIQHRGQGLGTNDLNDYKGDREGFYHQEANSQATPERNYPCGQAGTLLIYRNYANVPESCVQEYTTYLGEKFLRYGTTIGGVFTWGHWQQLGGKGITLKTQGSNLEPEFTIHTGGGTDVTNTSNMPSNTGRLYYWGNGADRKNVLEFQISDDSTAASWVFHCGAKTDEAKSRYFAVNGTVECTTVSQSSDRDLKDNIEVIPNALEAIRKMKGYTYTLKENGMPYAGVIAQEVMEALPEAVGSFVKRKEIEGPTQDGTPLMTEERFYNVDYAAVTGLLVQVCREQDDKITALEEQVKKLTEVVTGLQEKLK